MPYEKPQLSLWEKSTFVAAILHALGHGFYTSLVAPFRGSSGSAKYINHVKLAVLRDFLRHTSVRHLQATTPSLDEAIAVWGKKEGVKPSSIKLADGTEAFWVGNPSAEKVILWFHGGGYNLPPDPGHIEFAASIAKDAGPSVGILMLQYTLAPHETFPTQLREAVELLRYSLDVLKRKPENITLAGDSAGANLAVGVTSHILHPHPEIKKLDTGGKLGAAILLAPWVSFRTDWPSMTYNTNKDLVLAHIGNLWSQSFLGGKKGDGYSEPLVAENDWWKGLDTVVGDILVVAGGDEILLDVIKELGRRFEAVHPNVTTVVAEGEWHDKPINSMLPRGGDQDRAIKSFVRSRL